MIKSFPPVAEDNPKILILGSMPGVESLRLQQYYAYKYNSFWYIMGKLFQFDSNIDYESKKKHLIKNKVALWDVLKTCERSGSLDTSIKNHTIMINDFKSFFKKHKTIQYIFFNGTRASTEFTKKVLPSIKSNTIKEFIKLPSTSPAMASLTKEQKLSKWEIILNILKD